MFWTPFIQQHKKVLTTVNPANVDNSKFTLCQKYIYLIHKKVLSFKFHLIFTFLHRWRLILIRIPLANPRVTLRRHPQLNFVHVMQFRQKQHYQTRKHFSRMRTTRLLTVSRSIPCISGWGVCPTPGCRPHVGRKGGMSAQPPLRDADLPRRQTPPGGRPPPSHVACDACWETYVPLNRMTHRCKNITLPRTSFAGGNNRLAHPRGGVGAIL